MVLDAIDHSISLLPLVRFLQYRRRPHGYLSVPLLTVGGMVYVFIGALGVSINATGFSGHLIPYADTGPGSQAVIETVFTGFETAIMVGSWGCLSG